MKEALSSWRNRSPRLRLQGVRYPDGTVSLQDRPTRPEAHTSPSVIEGVKPQERPHSEQRAKNTEQAA